MASGDAALASTWGSGIRRLPPLPRPTCGPSRASSTSGKSGHEMLAEAAQSLRQESLTGRRGNLTARQGGGVLPIGGGAVIANPRSGSLTARDNLAGVGPLTMPPSEDGSHSRSCGRRSSREDKEVLAVCQHIGNKAAQKFRTVREAFRFLEADHTGGLPRSEVRYFFRAYDLPEGVADRFFDRMDTQQVGKVDYNELVQCFAPYICGGPPDSRRAGSSCGGGGGASTASGGSTRAPTPVEGPAALEQRRRALDEEFAAEFSQIRMKSSQKFKHARDLFHYVDADNDGRVTRGETRVFFRVFSLGEDLADRFHERLGEDACGEVGYYEFLTAMGPHVDLPGVEALCEQAALAARSGTRASRCSTSRATSRASTSTPPPSAAPAQGGAMQEELRQVMADIAEKAQYKFRHVRDAFRPLDLGRGGNITRTEMRGFLRGFGWAEDVADRLFSLLEREGGGQVDYADFVAHFDAVLGPNRPPRRRSLVEVKDPRLQQEINEIAALVGERLLTKYRTAREAFRMLDLTNSGRITASEMRLFFRSLNLRADEADKVWAALLAEGADAVLYDDFVSLFGAGGGTEGRFRALEELHQVPRPAGRWALH